MNETLTNYEKYGLVKIERMRKMIEGKVAVVTGGTRGIGFEIVRKFLNNGAKVALFGSKKESIEEALNKLQQENKDFKVIGFYPNLTDELEVRNTFKELASKFGKIDILVNNAGMSSSTKIEEYTIEEYDKISNINMKGVFVCSKEIVPYLKETKGCIINISSMVSIYGQPAGCVYPMSKFAVNGLTKSLSRELAPFQIRVNAVAPGIMKTDMVAKLPKEMIDPLINQIPLGRIGIPEDIANACLFLASDMASYITGEIMQVDGGARS